MTILPISIPQVVLKLFQHFFCGIAEYDDENQLMP
jgi:hypothetical protein